MKSVLAWMLCGIAAPALAQQGGQVQPAASQPAPSCSPEHAALGHCTMPPAEQEPAEDPHAGHRMHPAPEQTATDPNPGQPMPAGQQPAADPHAGHRMSPAPQPPQAPPPPAAFAGPENAADLVYDPRRMAASREEMRRTHGDLPAHRVLVERAETRGRDGRDGYLVDGQAWYGGDIDKAWFKGEAKGNWGEVPEHVELQLLWSHAIDPWFDLQAGVRYDPQPGPDRGHFVIGVQGLAPYWLEVDGALFLSNKGEITARAEAEHDVRITQKLVFQPRVELDFSLQDIPELGISAGLSEATVGARLRYHVSPLFAPYVGVEYDRRFGETAELRTGERWDPGGWSLAAGLRFWF